MSTIIEQESGTSAGIGRLIFLIAAPAVALTLMAALALQPDSPRRQPGSETAAAVPAPGTSTAPPSARYDADYTLYIMDSADDAHRLPDLGARAGLDWYAYVDTPEEEAELVRAREEADWFRYAAGLPAIRVVDLRPTQAGS